MADLYDSHVQKWLRNSKLADRIQPNPVAVENTIEQMEKLLTDLKELQKKGVQDIPYCDGFPTDFHRHLSFTKLCLEVLDENVSDVLLEQLEKN